MLAASKRRLAERLSDRDVVLDIGGWADPLSRADWVIDLMPYETRGWYQRKGWTESIDDGPARFDETTWIQRDLCDREPFPFEAGEIDFVVCSHTLEDIRDPIWVCSEMNRIGRAGYIEVPSRLEEQSYGVAGPYVGWPHHHWLIDVDDSGIEFVFKEHGLHTRASDHFPRRFWEQLTPEERVQTLWWSGGFSYRERVFMDVRPEESYLPDFVARELAKRSFTDPTPSSSVGPSSQGPKGTSRAGDGERGRVRSALKSLTRRTGFEVSRYATSAHARRARLLTRNGIDVVFDVGANTGRYAAELRSASYSGRIVSFEPVRETFDRLRARVAPDPKWECLRLALAETEGSAEINVAANLESSSFLSMAERHLETMPGAAYARTEEVETASLDSLVADLASPQEAIFLKLDVQGFEMHVLRGARGSLARLRGVETELSLVRLYDGEPTLREMLDYFADSHFELVSLEPHFFDPASGHVLQVDAIFLRP